MSAVHRPHPRRRRALRRAGPAIASIALAIGVLGAIEAVARHVEVPVDPFVAQPGRTLLPAHRYLLWVNAPGTRDEQGVTVRINSLGLRGPEPTVPKPPGVRRLIVTGDSVVYGFGVAEDDLMTAIAGKALGVEAWAAAVPGYSTLQTLNLMQMSALKLDPNVVIIANLWSDLSVMGFADADVLEAHTSASPGTRWASQHSALFRRVQAMVHEPDPAAADARVVQWRARPNTGSGGRRVPIDDYAANLDQLVDLSMAAGAEVAFLELPIRATVKGTPGGGSEAAYQHVFRDTARRRGCPLIDGTAALRDAPEHEALLWRDATHLSAAGHARVGNAVAAALTAWATGARLQGEGTGEQRPDYVDPEPTPASVRPLKVPDDMIPGGRASGGR